jgi:sugar transferase (PEP-CTERM/EpsH1 system associated)
MRVLFISTRSPYPLTGGHALRTFHLLREAARRHAVTFLTFVQHPEEWDGLKVLEEFCVRVVAMETPADRSRLSLAAGLVANLPSSLPFVAAKYDTKEMRAAIAEASQQEVDLLHLDMLPLAVYLDALPGAPTVLVDHNVEHILLERRVETESGLARAFWRTQARRLKRFEAGAVSRATRVIAVSDVDAAILRGLSPGAEVRTVPNGVDVDYFRPSEQAEDGNEIVFVGAMTHQPNVDSVRFFCESVWPVVRATRPGARFTVIGAHPPDSVLAYGKLPGVSIEGQVPDIRPYVSRAAVYVVPLRVGGGTRLKILDAMAMGKAIVSTAVGCEGLEVRDGHDIVVADEPGDIAAKVLMLMDDAALRNRLGRAARQTVEERYTWERLGEAQEAVYQEAVR